MPLEPLLSIITINLNNANGLAKTIESVLPQLNGQIEYLIIDGSSHDGSIDLIHAIKEHLAFWCTEKDKGIYTAMNKGIQQAKGDYLLFLNSGDRIKKNLQDVLPLIGTQDVLSLAIEVEGEKERNICRLPIPHYTKMEIMLHCLPHQSTFIKKALFSKHGLYDESFKIAADLEFWLRIEPHDVQYQYFPQVLSIMEKEGLGATMNETHFTERLRIFKRYGKGLSFSLETLKLFYRNRKLIIWYLLHGVYR